MSECIFCQIIDGQLPASIVHEDERCVAFMDIHPLGRGHVLVIPKQHAVQLPELDAETAQHLFSVARQVLGAQRALGWGVNGTHILLNDGKAANQMVPHVHVHVIPREKRDALATLGRLALHVTGLFGPSKPRARLDEQASRLREQLREA